MFSKLSLLFYPEYAGSKFLQMLVHIYNITQHYIPEDHNLNMLICTSAYHTFV